MKPPIDWALARIAELEALAKQIDIYYANGAHYLYSVQRETDWIAERDKLVPPPQEQP